MILYGYQKRCVDFHLKAQYSLNCSEMGLGKSRIALAAACKVGSRPLVFGPAFLEGSWKLESKEVGVPLDYVSYGSMHKVKSWASDFWIADEIHYLKSPTAKRTDTFYTALKAYKPKYFMGLTGTPMKNRAYDFWTLLAFCELAPEGVNGMRIPSHLRKYRSFARHFCQSSLVEMRGARFEKFGAIKPETIPELKELLRGKYLRLTVERVLKELPSLIRKDVMIETLVPDEPLQEEFLAYQRGQKRDVTAKTLSAKLKASATSDYVLAMIEGGSGGVLIFSDHVEPCRIISEKLDVPCITGSVPPRKRSEIVSEFQAGKHRALVATIGSLSVGVTLTAASHVVFNDISWVPSDNAQAEKRIHRIGQTRPCFTHFILATETDQHIKNMVTGKSEDIQKVLGG